MSEVPFPLWTTVTVGTLGDAATALEALHKERIDVSHSAQELMKLIPYEQVPRTINLAHLPGTAIGQRGKMRFGDFIERAETYDLHIVPPETAIQLWLQRSDLMLQVRRPFMAMQAFARETGLPMIFAPHRHVTSPRMYRYLSTSFGHDTYDFYGGRCWVFQLPDKNKPPG